MPAIIRLDNLQKRIKRLQDSKTGLTIAAVMAHELNEKQIAEGKDKDGKRFDPYTEAYAGRKGVGVSNVDLVSNARVRSKKDFGAGHMMNEFGITKVTSTSAEVGWTNPKNKQKAAGNFRYRKFVGLTDKNRKSVIKSLLDYFSGK